jgi:alanyl-tRNA synthetase
MKTLSSARRAFLDYFASQGHTVCPSAPLVPQNDPTLMFTTAGMVPFKDYFTGRDTPTFRRATSSQKCVRAGGKHNDLENVGYTARHHTFFEMLGNFSFGDYFKEEAIHFAWDMITKIYALPKDKLWVTIYHTDDEAAKLWTKIAGLKEDRIIRIATSDNFWSAGDTGPCGPCTEIFYDHGDHVFGGPPGSADEDGDRFMEIWNLVFMQYDQINKDTRIDLPKPSIDTGMGLERISTVLQGKQNNYDTDVFQILTGTAADFTSTKPEGDALISQRVIADHLRSSAFLIAQGVMPSNEGRGYVLRRIMRRAMRHAHLLGAKEPLMHRLLPALISTMGQDHHELIEQEALVKDTLYREENRFRETLARGLKLLDEEVATLTDKGTLSGSVAFKLYDTYGFPLDLTEDILVRSGYQLDHAGFEASMQKQQEMARASWVGSGDKTTDKVWFDIQSQIGSSEFLGYNTIKAQGVIQAIIKEGVSVPSAQEGNKVSVILSQTPFYAESGGQLGDTGVLKGEKGQLLEVTDCQKPIGSFHVHVVEIKKGVIQLGDPVEGIVDASRRHKLKQHHTATHLLHEALRRHLGDHVAQKGSLVEPTRLRLDFSQTEAITDAQMAKIIEDVRNEIQSNSAVVTRVMTLEEAQQTGARALFGEKYGKEVRVISMGQFDPQINKPYSVEFCGGIHVKNTAEIGAFRIISESSVSSGVRRIQAVVGVEAEKLAEAERDVLTGLAQILKAAPAEVTERVQKLLAENHQMNTEMGSMRKKIALGGMGASGQNSSNQDFEHVGNLKFIGKTFDDLPAKDLKPLADQFKLQIGSGVVVLITKADGRASLVVGVTDDLSARVSAVDLVRVGAEALGGTGGGGRSNMAQAGGPNVDDAHQAMDNIRKTVLSVA